MTFDNPIRHSLGPYHYADHAHRISFAKHVDADTVRHFTLPISTAFNAFGLIGSEYNGIVLLDDDNLEVICDQVGIESSGWGGPSTNQMRLFNRLQGMNWDDFRTFINSQPRLRKEI